MRVVRLVTHPLTGAEFPFAPVAIVPVSASPVRHHTGLHRFNVEVSGIEFFGRNKFCER